jgi:hypothetical protein
LDVDTIFGDLGVNVSSEIPYLEKLDVQVLAAIM